MKERVVCIVEGGWITTFVDGDSKSPKKYPVNGEIYTVINHSEFKGKHYIMLAEMESDQWWHIKDFRPVDDSFGEWVESTVMKEVEFEEAVKP